MGKALRLLNLQKDISHYDLLIDNYDISDRHRSLFKLIYPRKSRDRTHISFLRQINSNPCLICLLTCLSPRQGKLLTGFSHGAAGIAYALLRLYQATSETAFLEASLEAIAYENSVFIPEVGNWPDFRSPQKQESFTCMCSWCHGAAGIGLARVAGLNILDTDEIRQDIRAAVSTTKQLKLGDVDHLCCGNLGRVEFLFIASQKLSQPQLLETAMTQAAQVVSRAKQRCSFGYGSTLAYHPGFFQGASGIGYELLRLAYPDQLPSVLFWE